MESGTGETKANVGDYPANVNRGQAGFMERPGPGPPQATPGHPRDPVGYRESRGPSSGHGLAPAPLVARERRTPHIVGRGQGGA
jgi:hypothetical protein